MMQTINALLIAVLYKQLSKCQNKRPNNSNHRRKHALKSPETETSLAHVGIKPAAEPAKHCLSTWF